MRAVDVIATKRDGHPLTDEQIEWFMEAYVRGDVAEEQASALLMAIFIRGMDSRELVTWTAAMIDSGERLDLSSLTRPIVDKHSTGGVGDKVSLVLVPLVASCGAAVPQLSGRGLGHTGGTLDKLEAISGWRANLSNAEIRHVLGTVGGVICAPGPDLVPADRKLYALRDTTATVNSPPLGNSSIMSKKIAEGTPNLVLDVKVGSGAYGRTPVTARADAERMLRLGVAHGVNGVALLTDMDQPLGRAAGNALEVAEAVELLAGGGPPDVRTVTLALATEMLALAGIDEDPAAALDDGRAMDCWRAMITAQGGDPAAPLPVAEHTHVVTAAGSGYLTSLDALAIGNVVWSLGAGRARKEDPISYTAGVVLQAKMGDRAATGDPLIEVHADSEDALERAVTSLEAIIGIGPEPPPPRPLIHDRVTVD